MFVGSSALRSSVSLLLRVRASGLPEEPLKYVNDSSSYSGGGGGAGREVELRGRNVGGVLCGHCAVVVRGEQRRGLGP